MDTMLCLQRQSLSREQVRQHASSPAAGARPEELFAEEFAYTAPLIKRVPHNESGWELPEGPGPRAWACRTGWRPTLACTGSACEVNALQLDARMQCCRPPACSHRWAVR